MKIITVGALDKNIRTELPLDKEICRDETGFGIYVQGFYTVEEIQHLVQELQELNKKYY